MITEFEKFLYNEHLKASRSLRGKQFKYRQNFDDVDPKIEISLKRLSSFFSKFSHIKPFDFFASPFSLYPDEDYFPIDFFSKQRAIKAYSMYIKDIMRSDPDNTDMLNRIVDGLLFIKEFMNSVGGDANSYTSHGDGEVPTFITHLKENRFPIYVLYDMPGYDEAIKKIPNDLLKFIFGDDIFNSINNYRVKYLSSKKAKILIRQGLLKLTTNKQQLRNTI